MLDLEAFAGEYRGSWAPEDALWWAAHPGTVGPSGETDPAVAVRALRDRLYRPEVTVVERDAFAAAERALEHEQAEVARALAAVHAADRARERDARVDGSGARRPQSTRRWLLAGLVVAVVAVGTVAFAATAPARHAASPTPRPTSSGGAHSAPLGPLTAEIGAPVRLTPAQQRADDRLITRAFSAASPSASDLAGIETGQTEWAKAAGCTDIGGTVQLSRSGAPIDFDPGLVVGSGGSSRFRFVVLLERPDVVRLAVWAVPHGRSAVGMSAPVLRVEASKDPSRVVGAAFTTDRPADLHRLTVATAAGTPFEAQIAACRGG